MSRQGCRTPRRSRVLRARASPISKTYSDSVQGRSDGLRFRRPSFREAWAFWMTSRSCLSRLAWYSLAACSCSGVRTETLQRSCEMWTVMDCLPGIRMHLSKDLFNGLHASVGLDESHVWVIR